MMAGCLFLVYLVHVVIGYPVDDVEDVPLPPSYMEQQSQWQAQRYQPSSRQQAADYSPDQYYNNYAQAGVDPNQGYYDQQNDGQYPRLMQEQDPAPSDGEQPLSVSGQGQTTVSSPDAEGGPPQQPGPLPGHPQPAGGPNPLSIPGPAPGGLQEQPDGHVIPVYTPPKNKHTDKEDEPFLTPQWQSDEGIGDGRDPKIVAALEAITADLIAKGKELTNERTWAKQVESMLEIYKEKVNNVHSHTEQIRTDMKALLKKKRQIENVEVQNQLNSKLRSAQEDLEALDGAMDHVQSKADEFAEKKKKLEAQISKISGHIKKLQHPQSDAENEDEEGGEKVEDQGTSGKTASKTSTKADAEDEEGGKTASKTSTKVDAEDEEGGKTSTKTSSTATSSSTATESSKAEDEDKEKSGKTAGDTSAKSADKEPAGTATGKDKAEAKFRAQSLDSNKHEKKHHKKPHLRGLEDLEDLDE